MKKKNLFFITGIVFLVLFVVFTLLLTKVDVAFAGEGIGEVGFYSLNSYFRDTIGSSRGMYLLSEVLGYIFILFACFVVCLGLYFWVKNKSLKRVPGEIFVTGGLYAAVIVLYAFFEFVVINNRPLLIDGEAEASYPSSHTMLAVCIFASAVVILSLIVKNKRLRKLFFCLATVLTVMLVLSRLLSGYHWVTDIIGCLILCEGLVFIYRGIIEIIREKRRASDET